MTKTQNDKQDLGDDLAIIKITQRTSGGGAWVRGTIGGYLFDALVFQDHAANPEWEIGQSRISKLWIQRQADNKTVYNWDRGLDTTPANKKVKAIVDFLAAGLAEQTYGK